MLKGMGLNNMVKELVQFPIMQTYSKYLTEDEIKTDAVKTIQNRLFGMSEEIRREMNITEDFMDQNNLFEMIDDKRIRFTYDKSSGIDKPAYRIRIDYDGDGTFYDLSNPDEDTLYAPYDFSGSKPDYLQFSPDNLRNDAYRSEWSEGFQDRKKTYDQTIGTGNGWITQSRRQLAEFTRFTMFKLKNDIHNLGKEGAEKVASLIPGLDYNYDNWEEQSQKVLKKINEGNKLGITYTDGAYNFIIDNEEGGIFKFEAYENIKGDITIGYGLSLNDKGVINELVSRGYNIEKLKNKSEKIKKEDGDAITRIKVDEAKKISKQKMKNLNVDISGVKNSHLQIVLADMQYQGLLGPAFTEALANYINTGDKSYLGTYSAYTNDGSALRKEDSNYATRKVTVLQELYNDGLAARDDKKSGIFVRNDKRAKILLAWANGQYTNNVEEK